jgi:FMN-dependent NADH-azoreductase
MNNILHIDASGRGNTSVSRQLSKQIVQKISDDPDERDLPQCQSGHVLPG